MAQQDPDDTNMLYNENELQASIAEGERKLALRRQQRINDKRRMVVLCVLAAVIVPFCIVAGVVAGEAPSAPSLVVTWPKPKVKQSLAPGETVLARNGQPFIVEVSQPENWNVTWKSDGVESGGEEFSWAPQDEKGTLLASCKAKVSGWKSYFAWTWPRRDISIQAVSAERIDDYGRKIDVSSEGVWVYPQIFAPSRIQFDERALPLLASAIPLVASSELAGKLTSVSEKPTASLWKLVSNFEASVSAPADAVLDGTFATLLTPDIEGLLPQIAGSIVKTSPEASVKFILRLDKDPKEGIIRIAFDGKRERRAWVRRAGESAGGPFTGWEDGEAEPGLPPTLPRELN